jgi:uncharacterized alpha-E superfamily protein
MLSRLAESSFWLGRYLERTEGLSRLLLEFHQLLIQDQRTHVARGCALLTHGLGLEMESKTPRDLVATVYGDSQNPSTIRGAMHGIRSNARSIRDTLPSDFFESINRLNAATDEFQQAQPGSSLKLILDRLAVSNGIHQWLAPSDESSLFFQLGRSLERMDLVSRLLLMKIETEWKDQGSATTLRAVGGLSTFLRARLPITSDRVRHFLITETTFPRSLIQTSKSAELTIRELSKANNAAADSILRPIGILSSQIYFLRENMEEEEEIVRQIPLAVEQTSESVRANFFRPIGSIVWSN